MESPWAIIEGAPEAAAALTWKRWLGPAFDAVAAVCLRDTKREVKRVPCENGCDCNHRVRKVGGLLVGRCDCDEECPDIPLTRADVAVLELRGPLLGRAVADALECDRKAHDFSLRRTWQVAEAGDDALPVVLTIQTTEESFRTVVAELSARLPGGFILLAPTKQFCNAAIQELLAKASAGFFDMESNLTLRADGSMEASKKGKELFARLLAENAKRDGVSVAAKVRYSFRLAGSMCDIVFNGSDVFHLNNTDGAKYLDHLLHHPNKPIRAFDLEATIKPDKEKFRDENSIHKAVDPQARREARQELVTLKAELEEAQAERQTAKAKRLKDEIAKVQAAAGNESLLGGDTGERARDNVRKAINKAVAKLRKGDKEAKAFGVHLGQFVSLGYDVRYNQPENMSWG